MMLERRAVGADIVAGGSYGSTGTITPSVSGSCSVLLISLAVKCINAMYAKRQQRRASITSIRTAFQIVCGNCAAIWTGIGQDCT